MLINANFRDPCDLGRNEEYFYIVEMQLYHRELCNVYSLQVIIYQKRHPPQTVIMLRLVHVQTHKYDVAQTYDIWI